MNSLPQLLIDTLAGDITASASQVVAAVNLLDAGNTVPFISRYRKEVTGGLTDTQLRLLEERLGYLRELDARRESVLTSIREQGKLGDGLQRQIEQATTKSELEDLYLPYRKKRRTKGQIAIEAGLEPLAEQLWADPRQDPDGLAAAFIDASQGIDDSKAALDGARSILVERFAEDAALIARLRSQLLDKGYLCSEVADQSDEDASKFRDYFDHQEPLARVPGHRALAMFRGRKAGVLRLSIRQRNGEGEYDTAPCEALVAGHVGFEDRALPTDRWRAQVVTHVWRVKLSLHLETDLFGQLRERADAEAIEVFANNLRDLLLAAPAGARSTLGLDPGFRSGVKVCVVDATGKLTGHGTIYPHVPQRQWKPALETLDRLCRQHRVELVAIGNGTASRETEQLVTELLMRDGLSGLTKVMVSEAGASVYSASELAEREFPELDVTIRGAVSIARRLQDPLAELVKIEPRAIGVGQYQHDVMQSALTRSLDATVEDCVNRVGVDLNTASTALLTRVAGLSTTLAANIVAWRDEHGAFPSRAALKKVPRLGPRTFEQSAGFLRVTNGKNPLDASGVHPESYPVVKRILASTGKSLQQLIGDSSTLASLSPQSFVDEQVGLPTVKDILAELDKPGRDPRPEFRTARFDDTINELKDLQPDMVLEGVVTNVTNFGAFVDVGVHQDGLVHISALSDQFVKDPHSVVKAGMVVKVKVMNVDVERRRIGLSMRLDDQARDQARNQDRGNERRANQRVGKAAQAKFQAKPATTRPEPTLANSAMADKLREAFTKR